MVKSNNYYDVLIVGGGHAGCEAAAAAARLGVNVCLITFKSSQLGTLSCNPAMGGIGKGHIIREIDALGGIIGEVSDLSAIHYRLLNSKKGPAVQGPRAQMDRDLYLINMQNCLKRYKTLTIIEDEVIDLNIKGGKFRNLTLSRLGNLFAGCCVLATGTFLGGKIFQGDKSYASGRFGDNASNKLSNKLRGLNLNISRFKTGTPPRLISNSIDFNKVEVQKGDKNPYFLSFMTKKIANKQIHCFITRTTESTKQIVEKNLLQSPMYSGSIKVKGPRYCPSFEDKVVRFSDRLTHQLFLEPEGLNSNLIYPNGISTALPINVQDKFVKSVIGLENVKIDTYGYAVEYDYIDPRECEPSMELKQVQGLFIAGQICGTTGYEEAAAQGLIAGINAALKVCGKEFFTMSRADSYIGVLIDDLTFKGVQEPYRMFTSRSEYRLHLRPDNADLRLTPLGYKIGSVKETRWNEFTAKKQKIEFWTNKLEKLKLSPQHVSKLLQRRVNFDGVIRSGFNLLSQPDLEVSHLSKIWPELNEIEPVICDVIKSNALYDVYYQRQSKEIDIVGKYSKVLIPNDIDYSKVKGLNSEVIEKLTISKPPSLGNAARISGITPTSLVNLLSYLGTRDKK